MIQMIRCKPSRAQRSRNPFERGFSLLEVMFSMVFLAIGLLAVAQLIPVASSRVVYSRATSEAMQEGQSMLEELGALPYNDSQLAAGTHTVNQGSRTILYTVQENTPVPNSKRIDLTVSWNDPTGSRNVTFSTLLAKP